MTDTSLLPSHTSTSERLGERLDALRFAAMTQVLPVPSRTVPVSELVEFKAIHQASLRRLRTFVTNRLAAAAQIDDPDERQARADDAIEEIRDELDTLAGGMAARGWPPDCP